jgi:hypothetical protein
LSTSGRRDDARVSRYHDSRDEADLLIELGQALWGEHWQGPMAEALGRTKSTIGDWRRRRMPVPHGDWSKLQAIAQRRRAELDHLDPRIRAAHDAAIARETARSKGRS